MFAGPDGDRAALLDHQNCGTADFRFYNSHSEYSRDFNKTNKKAIALFVCFWVLTKCLTDTLRPMANRCCSGGSLSRIFDAGLVGRGATTESVVECVVDCCCWPFVFTS